MNLDISKIPWSAFGSRFSVTIGKDGLAYLKDIGGGDEIPSELFSLKLISSKEELEQQIQANENECQICAGKSPDRYVILKFMSSDTISIECCGIGLRLDMHKSRYDFIQEMARGVFIIQSCAKDHVYELDLRYAVHAVDAPWGRVGNEYIRIDIFEGYATIREYALIPQESDAKKTQFIGFSRWNQNYTGTELETRYSEAKDLASYILWSAFVRPEGKLTRTSVYSSKNWMTNIWSWDNCFCALAMVENMPNFALDQLLVFADNQHEAGVYPDFINDQFSLFSFCKPPIHGWALLEMIKRNSTILQSSIERIEYLYKSISDSTNFWLKYRRLPSGAIIYRHGNDSGWDNATLFMEGGPVESPDLYAYLSKQCDCLAEISRLLGHGIDEAENWTFLAESLANSMLDRLCDDSGFFARRGLEGEKIEHRGSFLLRMPIVAYTRLPEKVIKKLILDISDENRFLTRFGLASEALDSPFIEPQGYWRGPVWAPVNYLVFDALRHLGEMSLANRIAQRFVDLCSEEGMAENFDPIEGKGLDDPAFSWTSAVFLLFLKESISKSKEN